MEGGGRMLVLKFPIDRRITSYKRETFFNRVRQEFDYMEVMEVLIHIGFSESKHIGEERKLIYVLIIRTWGYIFM